MRVGLVQRQENRRPQRRRDPDLVRRPEGTATVHPTTGTLDILARTEPPVQAAHDLQLRHRRLGRALGGRLQAAHDQSHHRRTIVRVTVAHCTVDPWRAARTPPATDHPTDAGGASRQGHHGVRGSRRVAWAGHPEHPAAGAGNGTGAAPRLTADRGLPAHAGPAGRQRG